MLTVAVITIDTQRPPAGVDDDHRVRSIELAGAAEVFDRVAGAMDARL